jgi:hypothetical protein
MIIYLYKITNTLNHKIYVGIHKTANIDDGYMGSGTLLLKAIKKYGVENFTKEIIEKFDTYQAALSREQEIVNEDFLRRKDVYNLRSGGVGGFEHINSISKNKRINLIALKRKIQSGEIKVGGKEHWTEETYARLLKTGWNAQRKTGKIFNWWKSADTAKKEARRTKLSKDSGGNKNSAYGTHIYVDSKLKSLPETKELNKNRYREGEQPYGWITTSEWRDKKKNKNNNAYGRKWYNDGHRNYYLFPTDITILTMTLNKGRLKIGRWRGFDK